MTNLPISSTEDLNAAIQIQNPFAQLPYVGSQEVWGKEFPDVKSLNAHASDAVFQAINQIRAKHYQRTSIAITAESGTGKTHIISRIRHRLQAEGGALFIYATQFSDLNRIKYGFQHTLADSLRGCLKRVSLSLKCDSGARSQAPKLRFSRSSFLVDKVVKHTLEDF